MLHNLLRRPRTPLLAIAVLLAALPAIGLSGGKPLPLTVEKTAATSFQRTFDWSISKQASPSTVTTSAATTTASYTVKVTKGPAVDSGFTVSGKITVVNPNGSPATGVDITDAIKGGPSCTVENGKGVTIPTKGSVTVNYTCSVTSSAAGTNVAQASWSGGISSGEATFQFGAPSKVTNNTVDVTDAFNGGSATLLAGGDNVSASTTFTYTRTIDVPQTGCKVYPNVATITSPDKLMKEASAQFEACRTTPTIVTPPVPATPVVTTPPAPAVVAIGTGQSAVLRVVKKGPKRASAGQVVNFSIVIRNMSASTAARSVVVSDVLPAGYTVAGVPKGARLKNGRLSWSVGDLAPGSRKTVLVRIRLDRSMSGRRCNAASGSAANAPTVSSRMCTQVVRVAGASRVPVVTG